MKDWFERLEADTTAARQRFFSIPLVRVFLGENAAEPDATTRQFMREVYTRFLQDSYYYVRAAAKVYALAGSRVPDTDEKIREWLLHHSVEEYGHHRWIEDDLRALGSLVDPRAKPSVWTDAVVGYMFFVAGHGNPIGILGDTYVIESLSRDFATLVAGSMKSSSLQISNAAMNYPAKHGEADQGHMDEFRDLVNHLRTETNYEDILQVALTEFALYGAIVENLVPPEPEREH